MGKPQHMSQGSTLQKSNMCVKISSCATQLTLSPGKEDKKANSVVQYCQL